MIHAAPTVPTGIAAAASSERLRSSERGLPTSQTKAPASVAKYHHTPMEGNMEEGRGVQLASVTRGELMGEKPETCRFKMDSAPSGRLPVACCAGKPATAGTASGSDLAAPSTMTTSVTEPGHWHCHSATGTGLHPGTSVAQAAPTAGVVLPVTNVTLQQQYPATPLPSDPTQAVSAHAACQPLEFDAAVRVCIGVELKPQ